MDGVLWRAQAGRTDVPISNRKSAVLLVIISLR
jgi:hypothetical protein